MSSAGRRGAGRQDGAGRGAARGSGRGRGRRRWVNSTRVPGYPRLNAYPGSHNESTRVLEGTRVYTYIQ